MAIPLQRPGTALSSLVAPGSPCRNLNLCLYLVPCSQVSPILDLYLLCDPCKCCVHPGAQSPMGSLSDLGTVVMVTPLFWGFKFIFIT